jgi:hypothetical protein
MVSFQYTKPLDLQRHAGLGTQRSALGIQPVAAFFRAEEIYLRTTQHSRFQRVDVLG